MNVLDAASCPWCTSPLTAHVELTSERGTTVANDCPVCGKYVMPPEVQPLLRDLAPARYWNIRAMLESNALNPATPSTTITIALARSPGSAPEDSERER